MCTGRLCRHICVESVREVAPSAYLRTSGLVGGGYVSRASFGAGDPVSSGRAALGQCACGCVVYDYENALEPLGGAARWVGRKHEGRCCGGDSAGVCPGYDVNVVLVSEGGLGMCCVRV